MIEPRQTWRQNKDQTLVGIRGVINDKVLFYSIEGPRKLADDSLPLTTFLARFTREFTSDELDAKWREMAKSSHYVGVLEDNFQKTARQYEVQLERLRRIARVALTSDEV